MCTVIPLKVIQVLSPSQAVGDAGGQRQTVDISFIDGVQPGDWLSVHMGIARQKMSDAEAQAILDALAALQLVRAGETEVDHLFADLVGREPRRPPTA